MVSIFEFIKNSIKGIIPESRILLFGSRARGDFRIDSDYDLLIIVPYSIDVKEKLTLKTTIRKLIVKAGISSDILIESEQELMCKNEIKGHIISTALSESIEL